MSKQDKTYSQKNDIETKISIIMRVGVFASVLFMVLGFVLLLVNYEDNFAGIENISFQAIFDGIIAFNPYSIMLLGIFVLLLTPVIRVISTIVLFIKEHNKLYALITIVVLAILILSFLIGILTADNISDFL